MRPLSLKPPRPFKNLNAPYRMVFINEDSLEEVASFHLTKKSLYTLFSTIFLITILATVAVLLFTPLQILHPRLRQQCGAHPGRKAGAAGGLVN